MELYKYWDPISQLFYSLIVKMEILPVGCEKANREIF